MLYHTASPEVNIMYTQGLFPREEPALIDPVYWPLWVWGATVTQYFQVATVTILAYDLGELFFSYL